MANLSIKNVKKVYSGGVEALRDFNMEIEHGEFIVFVGPSGCGKSTMLRMIAGLETITDGELIMEGRKINNVAPADRNIAMVFQNYALFGTQTVYENIGFPLTVRHVNGDDIHQKVMEAAEIVEIIPELNRKPKQLSGGQRQRVAIGRSLVRSPEIFLMDEPLSNLDAKLRNQTRKELAKLHRKLGATFIYVTHDQVEAMTIADRIVVLNRGQIQQIGTPHEIYMNPVNMFVAGFIGSPAMNFLRGRIENIHFVSPELTITIAEENRKYLSEFDGKEVILGFRPEHFSLYGGTGESFKVSMDIVECLGSEYVAYFNLSGTELRARFATENHDIHVGDELELFLNTDKCSFFETESELRII
ncbi:sn-glycerol-3-phosphate ABC transporter ATP-binding protein UgpC [Spirochaeta isovalerica]|uniref:Multiple sugar transport system ATP-binding protein n=1 Tax=Spirochaeta isovalerica TaxID=150 RepID=A0A841R453_9SPIO|nr:multiple sugar transport system ATP-binding protein [Spirochaeta isovalerica]